MLMQLCTSRGLNILLGPTCTLATWRPCPYQAWCHRSVILPDFRPRNVAACAIYRYVDWVGVGRRTKSLWAWRTLPVKWCPWLAPLVATVSYALSISHLVHMLWSLKVSHRASWGLAAWPAPRPDTRHADSSASQISAKWENFGINKKNKMWKSLKCKEVIGKSWHCSQFGNLPCPTVSSHQGRQNCVHLEQLGPGTSTRQATFECPLHQHMLTCDSAWLLFCYRNIP